MAETKVINIKVVVDGDTDVQQLEKDINKVSAANKKVSETAKKTGKDTKTPNIFANKSAACPMPTLVIS